MTTYEVLPQGDPEHVHCRWCHEPRARIGPGRFCLNCDGPAAHLALRKHSA